MLNPPWMRISFFILLFHLFLAESESRQLAGIKWEKFVNSAELVFTGILIKGELSPHSGNIILTYKAWETLKGENIDTITFMSPIENEINKEIGRIALVFLKKENGVWKFSFDERSSWILKNEMEENYRGVSVYTIEPHLVYDVPEGMGQKMNLKRIACSEYRDSSVFVYPAKKVEKYLDSIFNNQIKR